MKTTYILIGLLAAGSITMAGSVTIPHQFEGGKKAMASEVNANFDAVKNAVNDNDDRITVNEGNISLNRSAIDNYVRRIHAQENNITTLAAKIAVQEVNITALRDKITLQERNITVNAAAIANKQARISGTCSAGSSIRSIDADGDVVCEVDNDTRYTAGIGLKKTGTEFRVDTSVVQKRLTRGCSGGKFLTNIDDNGQPACAPDNDSGGDITTVTAGNGLQGGGDSGDVEIKPADGYVSVHAAAFSATDPVNCIWKYNEEYGYMDTGSSSCTFNASIFLPDHATVSFMECTVYKNDGSNNFAKMHLYRLSQNVSKNRLGHVFWKNNSTAYYQVELSSFNYADVDNEQYSYFLKYEPYTAGEDIRVSSCRIGYQF